MRASSMSLVRSGGRASVATASAMSTSRPTGAIGAASRRRVLSWSPAMAEVCGLCGLRAHRFMFPDYSDEDRHAASALGCANAILALVDIDRVQRKTIPTGVHDVEHRIDEAVTKLASYVETLRKEASYR